jgi:hypothetical protein
MVLTGPTKFTWTGGTQPFYLSLLPGSVFLFCIADISEAISSH